MIALILLSSSLAAAQTAAPAVEAAVSTSADAQTVSQIKDLFVSTTSETVRADIVGKLSHTAPATSEDIESLYDLFMRFPNAQLRASVMASLALVNPDSPQYEPLFMAFLRQPEPAAQLFGINGAFRIHSRVALPLIHAIAERKLVDSETPVANLMGDRRWNTQKEALSALAQMEGEKVLPLLRRKADESPQLGALLGHFFWKQTLPDLVAWSRSSNPAIQQKALYVAAANTEPEDARATRGQMLAILRNPKIDVDLRHKLALKVGWIATDDEVDALIREHDAAPDEPTREVWAVAVFVSRGSHKVPLLVRYAREAAKPSFRSGARIQLVDMFGEEKTKSMLGEDKDVKK